MTTRTQIQHGADESTASFEKALVPIQDRPTKIIGRFTAGATAMVI